MSSETYTVNLVGCASQKLRRPAPARDLSAARLADCQTGRTSQPLGLAGLWGPPEEPAAGFDDGKGDGGIPLAPAAAGPAHRRRQPLQGVWAPVGGKRMGPQFRAAALVPNFPM